VCFRSRVMGACERRGCHSATSRADGALVSRVSPPDLSVAMVFSRCPDFFGLSCLACVAISGVCTCAGQLCVLLYFCVLISSFRVIKLLLYFSIYCFVFRFRVVGQKSVAFQVVNEIVWNRSGRLAHSGGTLLMRGLSALLQGYLSVSKLPTRRNALPRQTKN